MEFWSAEPILAGVFPSLHLLHRSTTPPLHFSRNVNRTSEPGLGANERVPSGKWRKSTTFRHCLVEADGSELIDRQAALGYRVPDYQPSTLQPSTIFSRARSSKRTVRLISGVALDECLDPERYRTRVARLDHQPSTS